MKLFNPFSKHKQEPQLEDSYLALTLTPDKIMACVWDFNLEDIVIKAVEERPFKDSENLIHETAVAIDSACQKADTDVAKVVFGLSQSWFEGEDISEKSAKVLKTLSEDMELVAQAFVSLASSINHFFKVTEGITPQAVLVGIFQSSVSTFCEVHKVFNSKVTSSKTSTQILSVEKINALIGQLKEGDETLPSRIIIYGNPDSELLEKLQNAKFEGLFVHQPKIDVVENDKLAASVAYAQAADILGHDPLPDGTKKASLAETGESRREETQTKRQEPSGADELGFISGVDILQNIEPEAKEEQTPLPLAVPQHKGPIRKEDYAVEIEPSEYEDQARVGVPKLPKFRIPKLFKMPSLPKPSKKLGIILAAVLVLVVIGIFAAGQTLTSAEVNIKVAAKSQDGTFKATVVPQGSYDKSRSQIPGKLITGKASGSQKATATGSKKIGNNAKGPVDFRNWTKVIQTFPTGTEIITDGLKFTLDSDISIPARNDADSTPGITHATITAEEVGPTYNVGSNKTFSIVGTEASLYDAKSIDPGISGGDEKQATVVSQDDLDKMAKSLTDSLTQKAKDDFKTKSQGANIPDGSLVVSILKKDFDKKVDDEASIINLDMEIEASAVSFDQNDLQKLISETQENQTNLELRPQDIEVFDTNVKRTKDTLAISGAFRAKLIPKFNEDQLAVQIAGKNIKEARAIIKLTPEVSDVLVSFSPAIPFIDTVPRAKSKISFIIEIS
ncbi:MAG: hypothetical protein Q7S45_03125 [Candidatus Curtissbacteria bacterium]|nr:hypothetical protein [Candidatus Curtissbacteria bacterium]